MWAKDDGGDTKQGADEYSRIDKKLLNSGYVSKVVQ